MSSPHAGREHVEYSGFLFPEEWAVFRIVLFAMLAAAGSAVSSHPMQARTAATLAASWLPQAGRGPEQQEMMA